MKNNKKVIVIGIMVLAVVLISILGTYAYFLASVGETVNEKLIVKAGTMQLVFRDTDEIVTNTEATLNFGDTITKEFEIENTGTLTAYAKISWDDLINTYLEQSLTYTLEYKLKDTEEEWKSIKTTSENVPRSEEASKIEIVDELEIPSGVTYEYRVTIKLEDLPDIDQTQDLGATLSTKFTLDEGSKPLTAEDTLKNLNLKSKEPVEGVPYFDQVAVTDETRDGLYAMEDDYGISYYYRGAVNNNYVKFGQNASGEDMWWRIIRINGDGSLRIQYDGTQGWANGEANNNRLAIVGKAWNSRIDDTKYVGWMFGGVQGEASTSYEQATKNETNSDIKTEVDNWYIENIKNTGYEKYLSDEIFCNDRSAYTDREGTTIGNGYGGLFNTYYGGYVRLITNKTPSFKCAQENDMFTLKNGASPGVRRGSVEGNKALEYPVGLITADEISAAGGKYASNNTSYYLYKTGSYYPWSLSPYYYNSYAVVFSINTKGSMYDYYLSATSGAVAPVINLSAKYVESLKGNGTIDSPYRLEI